MKRLILAALAFAAAAPAWAYTAYLKPDRYWPEGDGVSIEASYANTFFTPEIALPAQITILHPDGGRGSFLNLAVGANATTLFANLPRGGTYRFSSGEQLGPVTTLVGDSASPGGWRPLAAGETLAPDAVTTTLQTATLADVYVTRGTPTRTVVDTAAGHLVLRPVTHPNQVLAANGFEVDVLFDGAPMANTALVLYAAGDADTRLDRFVTTDAQGRARFTFDAPGQYLIAARHRANGPEGSAAAVRSYTTTLTFEVLAALPPTFVVPARNAEPDRRSRRRRDR